MENVHPRLIRSSHRTHVSRPAAGNQPAPSVTNNSSLLEELAARNHAMEAQLSAAHAENDTLHRALLEAAQVQRKLAVPRQIRRGEFEIAGEIFPLRYVSGDVLTVVDVGDRLILAIGDIAGKNLFASMWFTYIIGLIRLFAGSGAQPSAVLQAINQQLVAVQPEPPITTLFLASLDPRTGDLTYCNAGHPAPLILRNRDGASWLTLGGPLLGVIPDGIYTDGQIHLDPGDSVVAFSDGIIECRNSAGEDFDNDQITAALQAATDGGSARASDILFSLLGAAQDFAGGHPLADDLALMVVRRSS